jgi:hypothetical protein
MRDFSMLVNQVFLIQKKKKKKKICKHTFSTQSLYFDYKLDLEKEMSAA